MTGFALTLAVRTADAATPLTIGSTYQPKRMCPVTLTRIVVLSTSPSPFGDMIGLLIDELDTTGGTVSVMNLALRVAWSSGRVPS